MSESTNSRSAWLERKLAVPVLLSALVAVPAVFLMVWGEGAFATAGRVANWLSGGVLWVEWILLIMLAQDKRAWLRTHRWTFLVALATVPAVVFAVGPVQVLRLLQTVLALRVARVTRILEAGGVMARRMRLTGPWRVGLFSLAGVLAAAFVAAILADPRSESRRLAESALEHWGVAGVGVAVLLVAALAGFAAYRWLRR